MGKNHRARQITINFELFFRKIFENFLRTTFEQSVSTNFTLQNFEEIFLRNIFSFVVDSHPRIHIGSVVFADDITWKNKNMEYLSKSWPNVSKLWLKLGPSINFHFFQADIFQWKGISVFRFVKKNEMVEIRKKILLKKTLIRGNFIVVNEGAWLLSMQLHFGCEKFSSTYQGRDSESCKQHRHTALWLCCDVKFPLITWCGKHGICWLGVCNCRKSSHRPPAAPIVLLPP